MGVEPHIISLELAKKLKDVGVPQNSFFSWCDCDVHGDYHVVPTATADRDRRFSAFMVSEMSLFFPPTYSVKYVREASDHQEDRSLFIVKEPYTGRKWLKSLRGETEAELCGLVLHHMLYYGDLDLSSYPQAGT